MSSENTSPQAPQSRTWAEVTKLLSEPMPLSSIHFKVKKTDGDRALVLVYVDARTVMNRLDAVLGNENWEDDYTPTADGAICRLKVRLPGGEWVQKSDIGGINEGSDGGDGDKMKGAVSDALKRAAVKFGVGRYLYKIPGQWVDYDPHKKRIVKTPTLPLFAIPENERAKPKQQPAPQTQTPPQQPAQVQAQQPAAKPVTAPAAAATEPAKPTVPVQEPQAPQAPATLPMAAQEKSLPKSGDELLRRVRDCESSLATNGLCKPQELVSHLSKRGVTRGFPAAINMWKGNSAMEFAAQVVNEFKTEREKNIKARRNGTAASASASATAA